MTETINPTQSDRPIAQALMRGWRRRCPRCGQGRMMDGYLTVQAACDTCGQEFHHHRADDGPPYLTLLIVGHIVGPAMLWGYIAYEPSPLVFFLVFGTASLLMSLWFLPRLKGALIAIQWATRMYGFDKP